MDAIRAIKKQTLWKNNRSKSARTKARAYQRVQQVSNLQKTMSSSRACRLPSSVCVQRRKQKRSTATRPLSSQEQNLSHYRQKPHSQLQRLVRSSTGTTTAAMAMRAYSIRSHSSAMSSCSLSLTSANNSCESPRACHQKRKMESSHTHNVLRASHTYTSKIISSLEHSSSKSATTTPSISPLRTASPSLRRGLSLEYVGPGMLAPSTRQSKNKRNTLELYNGGGGGNGRRGDGGEGGGGGGGNGGSSDNNDAGHALLVALFAILPGLLCAGFSMFVFTIHCRVSMHSHPRNPPKRG